MLTRWLLFFALALPAHAQSYLVEPDIPTAQARSAALWVVVRCTPQPPCDAAQVTKYLLSVQPLTDGTATLVVPPGVNAGMVATNKNGTATLTAPEQAALATPAALLTKLPWIIGLPTFEARMNAPQLGLLNASIVPAVQTPWTTAKAAAVIDLSSPAIVGMVNAMIVEKNKIRMAGPSVVKTEGPLTYALIIPKLETR